jgi:hypothetical protein
MDFGWGHPSSAYDPLSAVLALGLHGGFRGRSTALDQEVKEVLRLVRVARKYINETNRLSSGGNWHGDPEKVRTWIGEMFLVLGLESRKMDPEELRAHRRSYSGGRHPWARMNAPKREARAAKAEARRLNPKGGQRGKP